MKVQSFGVIAQLVEHLLCKQGVVSSSLIGSTKTTKGGTHVPFFQSKTNKCVKGVKTDGKSSSSRQQR